MIFNKNNLNSQKTKPGGKDGGPACLKNFILFFSSLLLLSVASCKQSGVSPGPRVLIECQPEKLSVYQGEKALMRFRLTNNSRETIRSENNYHISYHIYHENGEPAAFENRRYAFPMALRKNKTSEFEIPFFFSYPKAGKYTVEFDVVKEGYFWGSRQHWQSCKVKLDLHSLFSEKFYSEFMNFFITTDNNLFDQVQNLLRLTLKNSESFTPDGKLFGLTAGSDYPQIWIRDYATYVHYALCYYPQRTLETNIELFLRRQGTDGEIVDWINVYGQTAKNTVETDQESSLLLAAEPIAKANPCWLAKKVNGKAVLERLEMALEWVWQNKLDPDYQLVASGFTADWGDIENTYPDQRATALSDQSTLTFSIYTQAKFIQAIQSLLTLAEIETADNDPARPDKELWKSRMSTVREQTLRQLYLNEQGYFITHIVPGEKKDFFHEFELGRLAVGGNAEAIIAGLMDKPGIIRFLNELEKRRREYRLRSVSFTLIPPYPEGFFPHHLMREPWNYQNGGEWDWIGARVVKALLLHGFRDEALRYLEEIVSKNLQNYCIYEWEDRNGIGRGALFYAGAAGLIGECLLLAYPRPH